jgi:GT2 family glycosyltransferase
MISAVVLAYNRCSEVLTTIDKLKMYALTFPFDIIVIDNASVDDTYKKVKEAHPDITLIKREKNNGIAGWNDGFKACHNKYMLVLDDDSHIHSGLEEAVSYLEGNDEVGILAMNIKDTDLYEDKNLDPRDAWQDKQDIAGFIGCGAIIRNEVYKKIGGFSEWLHVYTHEFDYGIRCLNAGYKIKFFKAGIVIHRVSKINRTNKRMITFSTRNELGIIHKYFRNQKAKYFYRTMINNLKVAKRDGLATGYYIMLGYYEFLKIRNTLELTPVSQAAQDFYAANFWSAKPILGNLIRRFTSK